MNLHLLMVNPSDTLVDWAAKADNPAGLNAPRDRPWYQLNAAPDKEVPVFTLGCKCGKEKISLKHHGCDGGSAVYIGQCPRCQVIVWTYRKATSNV